MIKKLGISQKACYYKLRKMLYEGKIKRDTSRVPFVYYIKEEVTNEGYGSHKK
jgi:DNA-binding Lrp family transcriptional regulator